jgi:outer membrane protein assembly factor BamB
VVGDRLIVNATVESGYLMALDTRTGKPRWKARINGDCWSTPAVVNVPGGGREVVLNGSGAVYGFDLTDGRELWRVESLAGHISSTPVVRDGVVYVSNAGTDGKLAMAIRAGGRGDVAKTHVLWSQKAGASHTSPVLVGGRLCWFSGSAVALDARDGRVVGKERLDGVDQQSPLMRALQRGLPVRVSSAIRYPDSTVALTISRSPTTVGLAPDPNVLTARPTDACQTRPPSMSNARTPSRPNWTYTRVPCGREADAMLATRSRGGLCAGGSV